MPGGIDEIGTVVERVTLIMNASYDVCIYREGKQEMFVRVVGSGANLRVSRHPLFTGDLVVIIRTAE